jgi:hypothetical protein
MLWYGKPLTEEEKKEQKKKHDREQAENNGYSFYICQKCGQEFSVYSIFSKRDKDKELDSITNKLCLTCNQEKSLEINKETGLQDK